MNILKNKYDVFSKITRFYLILTTVVLNCIIIAIFSYMNKSFMGYDISVLNSNSLVLNFREESYTIYNNKLFMILYIISILGVIIFVVASAFMEYINCLITTREVACSKGMNCFSVFEKRIKGELFKTYKVLALIFVVFIVGFLLISLKLNTVTTNRNVIDNIKVDDVFNKKTIIRDNGEVEQVLEIPMRSFRDVLANDNSLEKLSNLSILGEDYKFVHSDNGYYYFSLK